MKRLQGKVAIITGAASGIGRAIALMFAKQGAKVALTDINHELGQQTINDIHQQGGVAQFWQLDVSQENQCQNVIKDIHQTFGKIDILINNAGLVGADKATHECSEKEWDLVFDVDVKGVFFMTKHVIPAMQKNGQGSIVNLSSIFGLIGAKAVAMSAYHAAKGAVLGMTKRDAIFYAKDKIRVNALHPGTILTPLVEDIMKTNLIYENMMKELHPIGYFGTPEDVAYACLFLASDEAKFITGVSLPVDGGYTAQ